MSIRVALSVVLILSYQSAHAVERCVRDNVGNVYCEKRRGVDLSRMGLDGIEAGNRTLESQERNRASQASRETQATGLEGIRNMQRATLQGVGSSIATQGGRPDISCQIESLDTVLCRDSNGTEKRYREIK